MTIQQTATLQNFQINTYNKRENPNNYIQIILLSFLTIGMMIVSYIIFKNLISAATLMLCSIALMLYFIQKPYITIVELSEENFIIGTEKISWDKIKGWDMVETNGLTEIDLVTTKLTSPYITFYIPKSNFHSYNQFLDLMYNKADFQKDLAFANNFQNILRIIGLK